MPVFVSPEIIVWIGAGLFAQFSLTAHLLINISKQVNDIDKRQALLEQQQKFAIGR